MLPTSSPACAMAANSGANSGAAVPRTATVCPEPGASPEHGRHGRSRTASRPGGAQRMQGGGPDRRTDERRGQASRKERRYGRAVEYECPIEGPALHRSGLCEGWRCDDAVAGDVEPGPEGTHSRAIPSASSAASKPRRPPLRRRRACCADCLSPPNPPDAFHADAFHADRFHPDPFHISECSAALWYEKRS